MFQTVGAFGMGKRFMVPMNKGCQHRIRHDNQPRIDRTFADNVKTAQRLCEIIVRRTGRQVENSRISALVCMNRFEVEWVLSQGIKVRIVQKEVVRRQVNQTLS